MRTNNVAFYALRLSLGQVSRVTAESSTATEGKAIDRSAAALATIGIAISSFSLKQMLNSSKNAKF